MNYNKFRDLLCDDIAEILGEDFKVKITSNLKNNGKKLWAVVISADGDYAVPTIYLEDYYDEYVNSGSDIKSIASKVIYIYQKFRNGINVDVRDFNEFENVKDRIFCKLINKEKNSELLAKVPHLKLLDLAIVFYCCMDEDDSGVQTVLVRNEYLKDWKVSLDEIYKLASKNTHDKNGCVVLSMNDFIEKNILGNEELSSKEIGSKELGNEELGSEELSNEELSSEVASNKEICDENWEKINIDLESNMLILTNKKKMFGAITMLYKDVLKVISLKLNKNLAILPSSIHEVIIVPIDADGISETNQTLSDLQKMVVEVNRTEVAAEEILSDNVYIYDKNNDEIDMFCY